VTSKSPVGDISVVTLIRTDTTLDHSQKAEKVCVDKRGASAQRWQRIFDTVFAVREFKTDRTAAHAQTRAAMGKQMHAPQQSGRIS
jgi:hypothetical protein